MGELVLEPSSLTQSWFPSPLCGPWKPFQELGQLIQALSLPQISWVAGMRGQRHLGCRSWPKCHLHLLPAFSDLILNLEILQPGLSGHWSSWSWKNQLGLFFFQFKETTKVTVFSILCVFLWQNQTRIGCLADSQERRRKQPWVTCLRVHPSSYQTPAGCRDAVSRVLREEAMSSWAPHTSPGALRVSLPWSSPYRRMRLGCSEWDCPECMSSPEGRAVPGI